MIEKNNKLQNAKWLLIAVALYIPLILFHLFLPLHLINIRPVNGPLTYYFIGFSSIILIALPAWLSFEIIFKKTTLRKFKKVLFGFILMLFMFGYAFGISGNRKYEHLKKYGYNIEAKVFKTKDKLPIYWFFIEYEVHGKKHFGILEYPHSVVQLSQKTFEIVISKKDPRIYESLPIDNSEKRVKKPKFY
jgi:hypothetical protein